MIIKKVYYWSRVPGKFVNKETGQEEKKEFDGTVAQWYEGLANIVNGIIGESKNFIIETNKDIETILLLGNVSWSIYTKIVEIKKKGILPTEEDSKIIIKANNNIHIIKILDLYFLQG